MKGIIILAIVILSLQQDQIPGWPYDKNNHMDRQVDPIVPGQIQQNKTQINQTLPKQNTTSNIIQNNTQTNTQTNFQNIQKYEQYNFSMPLDNLIFFAIPHTHTDAGWVQTFNSYYQTKVKRILQTTVQTLNLQFIKYNNSLTSTRQTQLNQTTNQVQKMLWSDFAFFYRWWSQDADTTQKAAFHDLFQNGYYALEHGGWVQYDEATPDYKMMINNYDSGFQFLKEEFDYLPKIGFSLDGFGHSSISPYIFKALNLEGIVFWRVAFEVDKHVVDKHIFRWLWEGDNEEELIIYKNSGYSLNERFWLERSKMAGNVCFKETKDCAFEFIKKVVEPNLFTHNDTHQISFQMMGYDFAYVNAQPSFDNMKTLFQNLQPYLPEKAKIEYASYTQMHDMMEQNSEQYDKLLYKGDLFVYGMHAWDNWSGYYGTRAELKVQIKQIFGYLRAIQNLIGVARIEFMVMNQTDYIIEDNIQFSKVYVDQFYQQLQSFERDFKQVKRDVGILLHHDAITGTSPDVTARDYHEIITNGFRTLEFIGFSTAYYMGKMQTKDMKQQQITKNTYYFFSQSRKKFNITLFNPTLQHKEDMVKIKVYSHKVEVIKYLEPNYTANTSNFTNFTYYDLIDFVLLPLPQPYYVKSKSNTYFLEFFVQLKPLEMQTFEIIEDDINDHLSMREGQIVNDSYIFIEPIYNDTKVEFKQYQNTSTEIEQEGNQVITKQFVINTQLTTTTVTIYNSSDTDDGINRELEPKYYMENNYLEVELEVDMYNRMIINVSVTEKYNQKNSHQFVSDMTIFSGEKTKSCYYLFNPYTNESYIDEGWVLVNISRQNTTFSDQISFNYYKIETTKHQNSSMSRRFTLYKQGDKVRFLNMSYQVHNIEYKEMMVNLRKQNPQEMNEIYIDNSAFSIKRHYNKSYMPCPVKNTNNELGGYISSNYCQIGKNMYPMVNGFVWNSYLPWYKYQQEEVTEYVLVNQSDSSNNQSNNTNSSSALNNTQNNTAQKYTKITKTVDIPILQEYPQKYLVIITNRATGLLVKDDNDTGVEMFFQRQIKNANYEWGIAGKLEDSMETKFDMLIAIHYGENQFETNQVYKIKQEMKSIVNDPILLIEPGNQVNFVPTHLLGTTKMFSHLEWELDLIDFQQINDDLFIRFRNPYPTKYYINSRINLTMPILESNNVYREYNGDLNYTLKLEDKNLAIHCMEERRLPKKKERTAMLNITQIEMLQHRRLERFEDLINEYDTKYWSEGEKEVEDYIVFDKYELKCLKIIFHE